MSLSFFKELKNNRIEKSRFVDKLERQIIDEYEIDYEEVLVDENKISTTKDNIKEVEDFVKNKIKNFENKYDSYFDDDILKHLDILHNFVSKYVKDYPKYYDGEKINGKAFLDARDIIKNEMPIGLEEILNSESTITGIVNDTKINFENGFQMDSLGNIYGPDKDLIFKPSEEEQRVSHIDLLNKKVVTENGVRVDLPDSFIKDNIKDNEFVSDDFKERLEELEKKIEESKKDSSTSDSNSGNTGDISDGNSNNNNNDNGNSNSNNGNDNDTNVEIPENVFAKVENVYIEEKDRIFIEMPVDDLFLGDIFGDDQNVDFLGQLKNYKIESNSFGMCNFKEIPYGELNSLLFWGGGERGVKPLSSAEISDADISFKPDGTVYYSGKNSTIKTKRKGCSSKTYKTGHTMMWSTSNRIGMKRSIIQYIYGFCANIGIFNANIPKLIGFKKFKIFPGLCIGGLLEQVLCSWQERLSKRINEMFQCVPSSLPTDLSQSGFENETYPYGCSVDVLSDLNNIKSVKFGDKYVVNAVEPSVTGLKDYACGVFIFDPKGKLAQTHPWKYKDFRGKPFKNDDVSVIKDFSTSYNNPMVQDLLLNTNSLGEDSITRKMMSLQYAYLKKESLLSIRDVESSMDATIEATIYDSLDKLTVEIARYVYMESLHIALPPDVTGFESMKYCDEFFKHFELLTASGVLKMPDLKLQLRKYKQYYPGSGAGSENSSSGGYEYIEYYDFNNLNPDEYLIPKRDYVSKYDVMMYAEKFSPNDKLREVYDNNKQYLASLGQDLGKYKSIKTIRDFINTSEFKEAYDIDIKDNLNFIRAELEYDEYDPNAFQQVEKRCYYIINKKNIF